MTVPDILKWADDHLPMVVAAAIMVLAFAVGFYTDKKAKPGEPFLIAPIYFYITGMVFLLVLGADIFSQSTGITWTSPFSGR